MFKDIQGPFFLSMRSFLLVLLSTLTLSAQTAVFPNSAANDAQLKIASNGLPNAPSSLLASTIASTDTTINLLSGTLFPANTIITIESEKISICNKSGNTLTVGTATACPSVTGRGFDGTSSAGHAANTQVWMFIDAWYHNATRVEIEAIETYLLARQNYRQTFTNLTAPYTIPVATHGQGTIPTIQCWDNSSPAKLSSCNITMDVVGNITINATTSSPFSGFVIISGGH